MEVKKLIIPKTNWGIRYSIEDTKVAWRGMYILGINFIPGVEYNIFIRVTRRVVAIGYHRYWGKMHS